MSDSFDVVVNRADLLSELSAVRGVAEDKNVVPILAYTLVEATASGGLRFSASDLKVAVYSGCHAKVSGAGAVALPTRKLAQIAESLPEGEIRLSGSLDSDLRMRIKSGRACFNLFGLPSDDFPTRPGAKDLEHVAELPGPLLRELIERTAFASYYLAGALLVLDKDGAAMVATDGHRLAYARHVATLEVDESQRLLVPRKAIHVLQGLLEGVDSVRLQQTDTHMVFTLGGRALWVEKIEGQFPAFEKVIGKAGSTVLELDCESLQMALRRVRLLSSQQYRTVTLHLERGRLDLKASSPDRGDAQESLDVTYEGDAQDIGFNIDYLLDFLAHAGTAGCVAAFNGPEDQAMLGPLPANGLDYRYVVMPVRL